MTPTTAHGIPDRREADLPAGNQASSECAGLDLEAGGWLLGPAPLLLQITMGEIQRQTLFLSSLCGLSELRNFSMMKVKLVCD